MRCAHGAARIQAELRDTLRNGRKARWPREARNSGKGDRPRSRLTRSRAQAFRKLRDNAFARPVDLG